MVKPISLRIRHAAILRDAHAALARAGREEELRRSHSAAVNRRAREMVARRQEQDRLRRCAWLAAQKALLTAQRAYNQMCDSCSNEIDRERWRERRALVERELKMITEGRRP
jgi:hypothetical protein